MRHLDEGTIHAWLDGALNGDEASRVEAHAASCAQCARVVAEARGMIAAASRILVALDDVPGDVIPGAAPPTDRPAPTAPMARPRRPLDAQGGGGAWWRSVPLRAAAAIVVVAAGALATRMAFRPVLHSTDSVVFASDTVPATMMPPSAESATATAPSPVLAQAGTSAGDARSSAARPAAPERSAVPLTARPGRPGSRTEGAAFGRQREGSGAAAGQRSQIAEQQRNESRADAANAPVAQRRAPELDAVGIASGELRDAAAPDSTAGNLLTARGPAEVQRGTDSARAATAKTQPVRRAAVPFGAAAGAALPAGRGASPSRTGGVVVGSTPPSAAPPLTPSPAQMRDVADMVERSTPREIPGLTLVKHTVSEISQGLVRQARETVERQRYVHTLVYELVSGAQVELVVALPVEAIVARPKSAAESMQVLADSAAVSTDGSLTTIRWRDRDGTELQLRGPVSREELEALRARVRIPPARQR
jgi:anti-sigma factor RsiW